MGFFFVVSPRVLKKFVSKNVFGKNKNINFMSIFIDIMGSDYINNVNSVSTMAW